MKLFALSVLLLWPFACKQDSYRRTNPVEQKSNQDHIDDIILRGGADMGFSIVQASNGEGGAYQDTEMTILAANDLDPVAALKGFGNRKWSTPNLTLMDNGDKSLMWFSGLLDSNGKKIGSHGKMRVRNRGNGDVSLQIFNGPAYRLETGDGSISPDFNPPVDIIQVARIYPCPNYEVDGLLKYPSQEENWEIMFAGRFESTSISGGVYNRCYVRITIDANGYYELRLNDLDKDVPDATGKYDFSLGEQTVGSNGHPQEIYWYTRLYKFGVFSQKQIDLLQESFEIIWPLGVPYYPHDDGISIKHSWNDNDNTWTSPKGTFSGGSGTEGTYVYQWYYHNSADNNLFPRNNKLNSQRPIAVPSGSTRILDRDEMWEAGYYTGGALPGEGQIQVMCIRIPYDDEGVAGEPIQSNWILDNIP